MVITRPASGPFDSKNECACEKICYQSFIVHGCFTDTVVGLVAAKASKLTIMPGTARRRRVQGAPRVTRGQGAALAPKWGSFFHGAIELCKQEGKGDKWQRKWSTNVCVYAEANDLRERAKARNAYVYRFLTNDKDHHDEVLRFLTHDEQGPKIQIETDGCGNTWAKSGIRGQDSGRGQKILIAEDQMDQIRSWLESIEDKTNGKYMQESE